MWQVLPDTHPREEIDKIQAAISAPLLDQLDDWDIENNTKAIECPINNETVHRFRDVPDYWENIDHDYERILFERQKKQSYEQMRNMRYGELLDRYYQNNIAHHH
jgi:hypothetical protein